MCTAVSYKTANHYFGRNLDVTCFYGESVIITPRNFKFSLRCTGSITSNYAMIGMAKEINGYPLYFEASNEKGLCIAGLNFPDNAHYHHIQKDKINVTPFEFIPWALAQYHNLKALKADLVRLNIVNIPFSADLPLTPLHWLLADKDDCIVVESTKDGLCIYDNPFAVLTNNPPFPYHNMNMNNYMHLHEGASENRLDKNTAHSNYSLGMGALGLPGDFSSCSRFIKAAFVKVKSPTVLNDSDSVSQFFHILDSVAMPNGCVRTPNGEYEYTSYSCCYSDKARTYCYKTYNNSTITSVSMTKEYMQAEGLQIFPLIH